jgi:hypothetical protein
MKFHSDGAETWHPLPSSEAGKGFAVRSEGLSAPGTVSIKITLQRN